MPFRSQEKEIVGHEAILSTIARAGHGVGSWCECNASFGFRCSMLDGPSVAAALVEGGVTHVVWLPDSEIGTWEPAFLAEPKLKLIRVCREGEAFALAGGLLLGGKKPVVLIQCTGLFEAGDSLRNMVHDFKLPLFIIIGLRSYYAHQQGKGVDTCPLFTEPILQAWQIPYVLLEHKSSGANLLQAYRLSQEERRAGAVLIAE